jgi:hypothetical protein
MRSATAESSSPHSAPSAGWSTITSSIPTATVTTSTHRNV